MTTSVKGKSTFELASNIRMELGGPARLAHGISAPLRSSTDLFLTRSRILDHHNHFVRFSRTASFFLDDRDRLFIFNDRDQATSR